MSTMFRAPARPPSNLGLSSRSEWGLNAAFNVHSPVRRTAGKPKMLAIQKAQR
jgi:hypothetical protein